MNLNTGAVFRIGVPARLLSARLVAAPICGPPAKPHPEVAADTGRGKAHKEGNTDDRWSKFGLIDSNFEPRTFNLEGWQSLGLRLFQVHRQLFPV